MNADSKRRSFFLWLTSKKYRGRLYNLSRTYSFMVNLILDWWEKWKAHNFVGFWVGLIATAEGETEAYWKEILAWQQLYLWPVFVFISHWDKSPNKEKPVRKF